MRQCSDPSGRKGALVLKYQDMITTQKIEEILTRGVASFVDPQGKFKEKLLKKAKGEYSGEIIIKFGIDPTRPDIHLGHAVVLQKLRKLQDLGCKVIFLIGDITAAIGDPTGKSEVRPLVEQKEIKANMQTYLEQVGKILLTENPKLFSWISNSDWFHGVSDMFFEKSDGTHGTFSDKATFFENTRMQKTHLGKPTIWGITLRGLLWTLGRITHAQLVEREMFQRRIKEGNALYMHEMLYPVLQGIDSFAIYNIYGGCDLEIGGTDQTFNMLMGREIMKINNQPEQAVMSVELLVGTDGKEKMSKSLNNYIGITDKPSDMFGKIMSIPDPSIINYYQLCTLADTERINEVREKLKDKKINPRDLKLFLAEEITAIYHGKEEAVRARDTFIATFQKKEIPEEMDDVKASERELLSEVLLRADIISSKTDFRRLVDEGAIKKLMEKKEEKITDLKALAGPGVYKIGKRRFVRIVALHTVDN